MMRFYLGSLSGLLVLCATALGTDGDYERRFELLESQVETLQKSYAIHDAEIAETGAILENVERKSILDPINVGAELMLRLDSFHYENREIKGENTPDYSADPSGGVQRRDDFSKSFDPASTVRLRLHMNANLLDTLSFHGRLVLVRSSQANQRLCILSQDIKSAESKTAFDIEHAYIDYKMLTEGSFPLVLSMGVLPTTGGTPMHYSKFVPRQSLYPALVFNMNSYGMILTSNLTSLWQKESFLRLIAGRAFTLNPDVYPYQCNRENIDNADIYGLYFDTRPRDNILISTGLNFLDNFKARPYLGPNITTDEAQALGSIMTLGMGADIEAVAGSPLSLFFHTAFSFPKGNGKVEDYQIVSYEGSTGYTENGNVGYSEADYAKGEMIDQSGYALYAGMQYAITRSWYTGAEYNFGSKYWFATTQGSEDMYNKLATRGHVGEVYVSWQFYPGIYTKLGYMLTQETYSNSGWHFGEPAEKDATQQVGYFLVNAKF